MSVHEFNYGDRVVHTGMPEWGVGVVTSAQPARQDGKPCQRLTIRFERAGLKTLSTALATLRQADTQGPVIDQALALSNDDWLGGAGQKQVVEIMTRLPENATDPFSSFAARLKATLALYRYGPTGAPLIDWAAAQSGLKDPLSKFSRQDLEEFFRRFQVSRDQHLKKLVLDAKRTDPQGVAAAVAQALTTATPAARDALRRIDGRG